MQPRKTGERENYYQIIEMCRSQTTALQQIKTLMPPGKKLFYGNILNISINHGRFDIAEYLIDTPDIMPEKYNMVYDLSGLILAGQIALAKRLINNFKLRFNAYDFGTILSAFLEKNTSDTELFVMLCKIPVYINQLSASIPTSPIITIAEKHRFDLIKILLENSEIPWKRISRKPIDELKNLYKILFEHNQHDLIALLLKKEPELSRIITSKPFSLLRNDQPINLTSFKTLIPPNEVLWHRLLLLDACSHNHANIVEYFLENEKMLSAFNSRDIGEAIRELLYNKQTSLAKKLMQIRPDFDEEQRYDFDKGELIYDFDHYRKDSFLYLAVYKNDPDIDLVLMLYDSRRVLSHIKDFFYSLIDQNKIAMASSLLDGCPDLKKSRDKDILKDIWYRHTSMTFIEKSIPRGIPLSNGQPLLKAIEANRYDIVLYFLSEWPLDHEEKMHSRGNFFSRCTPDELAQTLFYLLEQNNMMTAKKFIPLTPHLNKSWIHPKTGVTLFDLCIQKDVPDLAIVRFLYIEPQIPECKPAPIIPREKISAILKQKYFPAEDMTAENMALLLKSYLRDPRKNSVPIQPVKKYVIEKIMTLITSDSTVTMNRNELNFLKSSGLWDRSLLKRIINHFNSIKELRGLQQAIEECSTLKKAEYAEMEISRTSCSMTKIKEQSHYHSHRNYVQLK